MNSSITCLCRAVPAATGLSLLFSSLAANAAPFLYPGPAGVDGQWGVRTYLNQGINGAEDLAATLAFLTDPATALRTPASSPGNTVDAQVPYLSFVDPQTNSTVGVFPAASPFPGNTAADDDHVITVAHALLEITEEDDYTFNNHSDDGFVLRITAESGADPAFIASGGPGSIVGNEMSFPVGTGDADTRGVIHLTPGIYKLEYVNWEGVGGFSYQLTAARGFFLNNADTTAWRPVGYTSPIAGQTIFPPASDDWIVHSTLPGGLTVGTLAGTDAAVDAALLADPAGATSSYSQVNFTDPETNAGSPGRIPGDVPWPRNTPADDNNYGMRMSSTLYIPADGDYLLGYAGDDGSRLTVTNPVSWRAFNDSAYKAGQTNSANATLWGLGRNFEGAGASGPLKNISSGADTPITASYTEFLTTGSVNSAGDAATYTPGSDAAAVFQGFVDIAGNMSYGDSPGWYVDLTLTGLDPAQSYTFAATANRNGGPTYASRVTNWTLMGADSSTYASSTAAHQVSPVSVEFSTGDNTAGLIARWRDIRAGADGTIVIRTTHGVGTGGGGIPDSDAFRGYAGGVFMLAEQSVFSAIAERSADAAAAAAATIGRRNTIAANTGSLGSAANFSRDTHAIFERPGALAGSVETAIETVAAGAPKMQVPFNAGLTPASFSVEAWVNPAAANAAGILTCVLSNGHLAGADPRNGWLIYQSDTGWNFRTYNMNGQAVSSSTTRGPAPVVGQWHHLVATWNGTTGTAEIYVNGVAASTAAGIPFVPSSDGLFTLGARSDTAFGWSGLIDEVAIYPSVLDASTVNAHIANANDAGRTTPYPDLVMASSPVGYWRLNETTQPLVELNSIFTDVPTGNSATVGRIRLAAGAYPISAAFYEIGGGSWFEIFGRREIGAAGIPFAHLSSDAVPNFTDATGLTLAAPRAPTVTNFNVATGSVSLTFSLTPGLNYVVESSFDLVTWTPRATILSGPGQTTAWTSTLAALGLDAERRVFWRARIE